MIRKSSAAAALTARSPDTISHRPAFLPLLLILFFCSGASALIYEIVWFQLLQFAIGSSAYSIGVLLGTFMGGMCIGSLLFPRLVSPRQHPLRVYAALELCIGVLGVLISAGMPLFDRFYAVLAQAAGGGIVMRAAICSLCLLPPTILMGATLPAIARWAGNTPRGAAWLGFFYGGNTAGAVAGCLLAGFYLLRVFDLFTAACVAASLNLLVGVLGFALSSVAPHDPAPPASALALSPPVPHSTAPDSAIFTESMVYFSIAFSGMAALGAEVIWTRLLSLLFGGTVYSFSIILAVFLAGLGIGSSAGSLIIRTAISPRTALAWCQALCAAAIGWTAYAVTNGLPNWPVNPYFDTGLSARFELDIARCAWGILLPTIFWGASFPLAIAAVISAGGPSRDPAKSVGRVYAANTLGAIAGSLFFSLFAIKTWGSTASDRGLVILAAFAAIAAAAPSLFPAESRIERDHPALPWYGLSLLLMAFCSALGVLRFLAAGWTGDTRELLALCGIALTGLLAIVILAAMLMIHTPIMRREDPRAGASIRRAFAAILLLAAIPLATLLALQSADVDSLPWQLVAWGRRFRAWNYSHANNDLNNGDARLLYLGEGLNSSVAVTTAGPGTLNFHVAGKVEASTDPQDMRLQLMLGHFPALFLPAAKQNKKALIVGCGAGVTAGTFILHKDFGRIVICEIEPLVPKLAADYFHTQNNFVVSRDAKGRFLDPRVQLVDDDARHFILTTPEKFDVITSDPIHPWVKGAASLYTREYFELVKQHLNPGGLVTQWVPLYESNETVVKSEIKTFFDVFKGGGVIWSNDASGAGYDIVLMGSNEPLAIDAQKLQSRMDLLIPIDLAQVRLGNAIDVLETYAGNAAGLESWLARPAA